VKFGKFRIGDSRRKTTNEPPHRNLDQNICKHLTLMRPWNNPELDLTHPASTPRTMSAAHARISAAGDNRSSTLENSNQECTRMDPAVLILDQNSSRCVAGKCDALAGVLQKSLAARCTEQRCDSPALPNISPVPDLVLLRSEVGEKTNRLIASCKKKWTRASILALLCPKRDRLMEYMMPVLASVDDFVACPFQEAELLVRVKRLLQPKQLQRGSTDTHPVFARAQSGSMVGQSPAFLRAIEKVAPFARSRAPVLISGETGTGKELFARALHYEGPRHGKPFIPVNCGALPDHLFENELFGHAKGAFTDASSAQKGLIAEAEGGTLFLDEIDALSASAQIKLLRFLQDGEYRPLGLSTTVTADVRVIAATNSDLRAKVEQTVFREDLYHRLNVLSLIIPSLRERFGDIALLAGYFLNHYSRQYGRQPATLSEAAVEKLMSYSWPGNVRELEGFIEKSVVLNSLAILQPENIELPSAGPTQPPTAHGLREEKSVAVGSFELAYLMKLMATHHGNVSHAAKAAGKVRRTLQRLLRRYNIDRGCFQ
jgi:DNA-binding NtrC family response regulator